MSSATIHPDTVASHTFRALGATIDIAVTDASHLDQVVAHISARLDDVDRTLSRFRPDSELSLLEREPGRPRLASPLFLEALERACHAAASTDGWFDPTVRDAVEAAGYDRSIEQVEADGPGPARSAQPAGQWHRIWFHRGSGVLLIPEGVRLDFGGIGKGFAVDYALRDLADGPCGVLLNAGGDIGVTGPPPEGGWNCEIAPTPDGAAETTIPLRYGAIATSGLGRRQWVREGQHLHHLIDPHTGYPAESPWRIVSVFARHCAVAEVAAKVGWLRGEDGPAWMSSLGLSARFSNEQRVVTVGSWPREIREVTA
jgi:thiamine biosynthesis lipoprotein